MIASASRHAAAPLWGASGRSVPWDYHGAFVLDTDRHNVETNCDD
jgi:hypothetical protein